MDTPLVENSNKYFYKKTIINKEVKEDLVKHHEKIFMNKRKKA